MDVCIKRSLLALDFLALLVLFFFPGLKISWQKKSTKGAISVLKLKKKCLMLHSFKQVTVFFVVKIHLNILLNEANHIMVPGAFNQTLLQYTSPWLLALYCPTFSRWQVKSMPGVMCPIPAQVGDNLGSLFQAS